MKAERIQALILKRSERYKSMRHTNIKMLAVRNAKPSDTTPALSGQQTAMYVILNADDRVIYCGQTAHPGPRMSNHKSLGRLTDDCSVAWLVCVSRHNAVAAEGLAIAVLNPRDNVDGRQYQWEKQRGLTLSELEGLASETMEQTVARRLAELDAELAAEKEASAA